MSDRSTLAFRGDAAAKAAWLAQIDAAEASDRAREDDSAPPAIAGAWADTKLFAESHGLPMSLVALLDRLVLLRARRGGGAYDFLRSWFGGIAVGADLSAVPTALAIWLLQDAGPAMVPDSIGGRILALHRRDAAGEPAARRDWAELRAAVLAASEGMKPSGARPYLTYKFWEAAAWPAGSSRSILVSMADSWASLAAAMADPAWSDEDEARKETLLWGLWEEFAQLREADEPVDYPAMFQERDPDLCTRFVAHLDLVNGRRGANWDRLADICVERLSQAEVAVAAVD